MLIPSRFRQGNRRRMIDIWRNTMPDPLLSILENRKSVRAYLPDPIAPDTKTAILHAALQAPTAGNMMLYTILDIVRQDLKDVLSVSCDNQPFIARAPMVLIFCADYRAWYEAFAQSASDTRAPMEGDLILAFCDALIAAQNAVIAAEALGVGSCYIGDILENYETHKELLKLPRYVLPAAMLCFDYPTVQQSAREKPERFALADMVCPNEYRPRALSGMLAAAQTRGMTAAQADAYMDAFRKRKWDSAFSREMSRSVREMIADWTGKQ
jgi:FMN reductase (NADPH)